MFFCLVILLAVLVSRACGRLRRDTALLTERRLRLVDELVSNARGVKMHCLEPRFQALTEEARRRESSGVLRGLTLSVVSHVVFELSTRAALLCVLAHLVLTGHTLSAEALFDVFGLYNNLRLVCLRRFSMAVQELSEILISIHRIEARISYPSTKADSTANPTSSRLS